MIHAGVADSRQWNNEFAHFAQRFRVLRYDLRCYGKSEPVEGEFSIIGAHDTPFILAAADYMLEKIPTAQKVVIEDAAHLPNMDQPEHFRQALSEFLDEVRSTE